MALTGVFPRSADQAVEKAPLELMKCGATGNSEACGLVQLRHSVDPELLFGDSYGYRSSLNGWMVRHLEGIAQRLKQIVPLTSEDTIVDIGSNDGTLLQAFGEEGPKRIGVDPLGAQFRQYYSRDVKLVPEFFSASRLLQHTGGKKAKLITSVAMLYDLERPVEFVEQIAEALREDGLWFCEQSYLPSMLARGSYDTICHEHLEYYSLRQIQWMAAKAGMRILSVWFNEANGGSFAVLLCKAKAHWLESPELLAQAHATENEARLANSAVYRAFKDRTEKQREALKAVLHQHALRGEKVFGYGASTKGNVILQFCGITPRELPCIAEINPDKYGSFTPGTGIPIVSEEQARAQAPAAFMVLPWHFRDAIIARESAYLSGGGSLLFPLPDVELYRGTPQYSKK
jgi:NDP-4-keto-2,6-dideoxyhexose 3-C-methyltransferase